MKIQGHPDLLKGYDPDVHEIGPEKFVDFAKQHNLGLSLGVDSRLLTSGPASEIVNRVSHYVTTMGNMKKANLFLNEVTRECASEHVHEAVQTAKFFGTDAHRTTHDYSKFRSIPEEPFSQWVKNR